MAELKNTIREIASMNRHRRTALKQAASVPSAAETPHGLSLAIGKRVLDLVTGQEGVIIDAAAQHIIIGGAGKPAD